MSKAPLRYTKQISETHWMTKCNACRGKLGRRNGTTEREVDEWWARHIRTDYHKTSIDPTRALKRRAAEDRITEIFGPREDEAPVRPLESDLSGAVVSRPHVGPKWRDKDDTIT